MQRVLIIGSNGAGKSTFSYQLAQRTGLPLIHLDQIYWRECWQVTPRDAFLRRMEQAAKEECWIIEGNNVSSLDQRLPYADTVFWFEFSPLICILGILKREWQYRGKVRPDMPDRCVSRLDFSFLRYAWLFNRRNRTRIRGLLAKYPHLHIIRFTNRRHVRQYLDAI
ncbi:MAG: isopentenyl transferase family protein [bacterium]|nr:isopentenyl transferase family protein [bacterium]